MLRKKLRSAKASAALLVSAGFFAFPLLVQASGSQGLAGSYIGIGSAPKAEDVTKKGEAIVLDTKSLVDYRAQVDAGNKTNANGEGVTWRIDNNGLFAGGYGAYAVQGYSTALGTYSGAVSDGTALGAGAFARDNSLAAGKNVYAWNKAVAAGVGAKADLGVAIGYGATAGRFYKYVQGTGYQDFETIDSSVAIGLNATAEGGVALGAKTKSGSLYGTAVGNKASVVYSGVALGNSASVTVDTGVALGIDAVADRKNGIYGYVPFADDTKKDITPTSDASLASAISAKDSVKNFRTTYANEISEYNKLNQAYYAAHQNAEKQKKIMLATTGSADPAEQKQAAAAEKAYNQYNKEAAALTQERSKWTAAHPDFMNALRTQSTSLRTFKSTEGALSVGVTGLQTRQIINVAAGTEDTDAVNVAQLKRVAKETENKANLNAGNLTDGDVSNWQKKLGSGTVAKDNTGLVTGGTVHSALEEKADKSLGNITGEGKTVISNIAKDSVKVIDGTNTTVTVGADGDAKTYAVNVSNDSIKAAVKDDLDKKADKTADNLTDGDVSNWQKKLGNGTVAKDNTGLVTGGTVHSALEEKADKSLGNITGEGKTVISNIAKDSVKVIDGTNTTVTVGADGDAKTYAVNVSNDSIKAAVKDDLDKKADKTYVNSGLDEKADKDASNLSDGDVSKWQEKLGNGKNAAGNTGLITGDTLNKAISSIDVSGQIVNKADTNLGNITNEGKTVIRELAQDSVAVKGGKNVTVDEAMAGNTKTYTVNVSNDSIKAAVKDDLDKKANKTADNLTDGDVSNWQKKLGNGTVAKDNTGLVTGGTVHSALEEKADKSLGNITGEGKTVISNIAKDSVKVIDGTNTTVTVGADGDAKTYAVNVSNDSIKAAVKDDLDKKANKTADNLTDGDVNSWKDKLGVNDLTGQINGMDNRINHLDTRIDRVGAGAAALAALHPQDYDPEAKWDFAAGYGRYRDANALAIGAFYRPNDGTMFSIGGSMGGGEDMINVGLSLKVGHRNQYAGYSKASLTSVIAEQKATIGKLENQVASQQKQIEEILQQLAALKK